MDNGVFRIEDRITGKCEARATNYIHLAPGISASFDGENTVTAGNATITFEGHHGVDIFDSYVSVRYNELLPSKVIAAHFHAFLVIFIK